MKNKTKYRRGVGALILNQDGKVFAGKRCEKFIIKGWQMPQGGIDDGEEEDVALKREVYEETGIKNFDILAKTDWLYYDLPKEVVPIFWQGRYIGQRQIWYKLIFKGDENEINLELDEQEFQSYKWMTKEEILENIVDFKQDLYKKVFEEFNL